MLSLVKGESHRTCTSQLRIRSMSCNKSAQSICQTILIVRIPNAQHLCFIIYFELNPDYVHSSSFLILILQNLSVYQFVVHYLCFIHFTEESMKG